MRISDVALNPWHIDPHVRGAPPPDLYRIAKTVDRSRLADQDHVRADLPLVQPVDDPGRAISRVAFFIAGDQERQGAVRLFDFANRGDEGGDGALHVVGAAADQDSVLDERFERVAAPVFAGRNHVEVPRESQVRRAFPANRDHVLGRPVRRLAHRPAMDGEAEALQLAREDIENLAARGCYARASDQLARELYRVD